MYDMQRTSTLGITKFSGTGELKFKHLYDVAERQRPRVNKVGQMALSNFREMRKTREAKKDFLSDQDWILSRKDQWIYKMRGISWYDQNWNENEKDFSCESKLRGR